MADTTKYRNYSNKELLQLFNTKRNYSDLIEEMCQRLECVVENDFCPICDGNITEYNEEK